MQVTINVPDRLAAEAQARGLSIEAYTERLLAHEAAEATQESGADWIPLGGKTPTREETEEAVRQILEFQQHHTLGGLKLKDLIHEGHKY